MYYLFFRKVADVDVGFYSENEIKKAINKNQITLATLNYTINCTNAVCCIDVSNFEFTKKIYMSEFSINIMLKHNDTIVQYTIPQGMKLDATIIDYIEKFHTSNKDIKKYLKCIKVVTGEDVLDNRKNRKNKTHN